MSGLLRSTPNFPPPQADYNNQRHSGMSVPFSFLRRAAEQLKIPAGTDIIRKKYASLKTASQPGLRLPPCGGSGVLPQRTALAER